MIQNLSLLTASALSLSGDSSSEVLHKEENADQAAISHKVEHLPGFLVSPFEEWIAYSYFGHSTSITKSTEGYVVATNGRQNTSEPKNVVIIERTANGQWKPHVFKTPKDFSSDPKAFVSSPVLFKVHPSDAASMEYLLFFRIGTGYETKMMQSLVFRSTDGCKTFMREVLPEGIVGPTKCKPLHFGNYLVFGSSIERGDPSNKDGTSSTNARIEVYDLRTGNWFQSPELTTKKAFGAIEPTFCTFEKDGTTWIRMLCRNRSQGFALETTFTLPGNPEEKEIEWPKELISSTLPNCDSGLDLIDLSGKTVKGKLIPSGTVIAFGNFLGSRKALEMALSSDGGATWSKPISIDSRSGEFPACYFDEESGLIHLTYASNKPELPVTKENQTIRHLEIDPASITLDGENPWLSFF